MLGVSLVRIIRKTWLRILIDWLFFITSIFIAFFLRFEFSIPSKYIQIIFYSLLREIPIFFVFYFFIFKIYRTLWEYFSLEALKDLTLSLTLEKLLFYLSTIIFPLDGYPRSVFVISYVLSLIMLFSLRAFVRWFYETTKYQRSVDNNYKRVIIIGAGDAGEKILREIKTHKELNYNVVGFLDDDKNKIGKTIHGVKVLGPISSLLKIAKNNSIDEILIAIPSAPSSLIRDIVTMASKLKIPVKTLPGIWELIDGRVSINKIRNVRIEDLLERDVINLDSEKIREYIQNKRILVTGAGGSIGSEICRQVARYRPEKLILLGRGENSIFNIELELKKLYPDISIKSYIADIKDRDKIFYIFENEIPNIIFHSAAHKHVPLMEENPDEAVFNNVFGTINVMDASINVGAEKFIFISTDKAVYPANIMGATKRIGEMLVKFYNSHSKTSFIAVRFGNVLGSRGSVLEVFKKQLENGGPITITDPEMERYFMTIPEAVGLVLQAGSIGNSGDIFVLDMGKPVKIIDLAKNFIELSGHSVDDIGIEIIGLRPGEKLREELWEKEERIEKTSHPKIFKIISYMDFDKNTFNLRLEELKESAGKREKKEIEKILMEIIPTYKKDLNIKKESYKKKRMSEITYYQTKD
jgi:FlaA1/EpsC-like NDP-sugar epimerase